MQALFDRWTHLLDVATTPPDQPLGHNDLLTPRNTRDRLSASTTAALPLPEASLAELFTRQVAKTPDASAVTDDDCALTYAELDARANGLAHELNRAWDSSR